MNEKSIIRGLAPAMPVTGTHSETIDAPDFILAGACDWFYGEFCEFVTQKIIVRDSYLLLDKVAI